MMWNANDRIYQAFDNGDYVHVQGSSQLYNGSLQVIIQNIDAADQRNVNDADFVLLSEVERSRLLQRLQGAAAR